MNKKIMMTIGAIAAVLGLVFSQNLSVSAGPDLTVNDVREKVQSQYPGEITELELTEEGKNPVYQVEIVIEGKEYELLIDGNSGEVLKLDEKLMAANDKESTEAKTDTKIEKKTDAAESTKKEEDSLQIKEKNAVVDDKAENKSSDSKTEKQVDNQKKETAKAESNPENKVVKEEPKSKPKAKKTTITEQEAIDIALKQFSGSIKELDLDKDDGQLIYDIEVESSRGEAEIEIDAYTGKVLVVDIDLEDDDNDDD